MWTHTDYPGIKFDADFKRELAKPFRLEGYDEVKKKSIRRSYKSWQAAKKAGWVKAK